MGLGVQRLAPVALPPVKETRYLMYRRLVGPQDRSVRVRETSSLLGFDARTVQTIASRYIDDAIPAHQGVRCLGKYGL
jgi:hypothetical protein